jgi:hypothetical protein
MDNELFLHWIVWTLATSAWCAVAYHRMKVSRPFAAILVGAMALLTGYIKELTDVEFSTPELWADLCGITLGTMLFFLLVRRRSPVHAYQVPRAGELPNHQSPRIPFARQIGLAPRIRWRQPKPAHARRWRPQSLVGAAVP